MATATSVQTILHLGCGRKKWAAPDLLRYVGLSMPVDDARVIHVDADPRLEPDLVCDVGFKPLEIEDNSVDCVIAWHMLEHIGQTGDTELWFAAWEDIYRVLKPSGFLYAESPYYDSIWAWSDPTHVRALSEHSLIFFSQASYRIQENMISPYRIRADFQWARMPGLDKGWAVITDPTDPRNRMLRFAMAPIKPFRGWWED